MPSSWVSQRTSRELSALGVSRATAYELRDFAAGTHAGLPSRSMTLIVSFGPRLDVSGPGPGRLVAQAIASGLHAGPAAVRHDGTQVGIQLSISPLASRSVFGVPAAELSSVTVGLDDVVPGVVDVLERTWDRGFDERFTSIERLLAGDPRTVGSELAEAWRLIERTNGTAAIEVVARHVGWSRRHLTDRFTREFGLGPKELCRVIRFERAAALMACSQRLPLARIAVEAGYSDQAHFTREWTRLSGVTPGAWLSSEEFPFVQDEEGIAMGEWSLHRRGELHGT